MGIGSEFGKSVSRIETAEGVADEVALGCPVCLEEKRQLLANGLCPHIDPIGQTVDDGQEEQSA